MPTERFIRRGRKTYRAPTLRGSTRQAAQTMPRPTLPLPCCASAARARSDPVAANRAAAKRNGNTRTTDHGVALARQRSSKISPGRGEIEMPRTARLDQGAAFGIDPGNRDHAIIACRILRWRGGAIIANRGHDHDPAAAQDRDGSLNPAIGGADQAHGDERRALRGCPTQRANDHRRRPRGGIAAIDIANEQTGPAGGTAKCALIADEEKRRQCRARWRRLFRQSPFVRSRLAPSTDATRPHRRSSRYDLPGME